MKSRWGVALCSTVLSVVALAFTGVIPVEAQINPCAAKTINPCAAKTLNPCAAKALSADCAKILKPELAKTISASAAKSPTCK